MCDSSLNLESNPEMADPAILIRGGEPNLTTLFVLANPRSRIHAIVKTVLQLSATSVGCASRYK